MTEKGKTTTTVNGLISSLPVAQLAALELLKTKRDYWSIEALHYRLDDAFDEDRSRVRTPKAALVLGMFRRLAMSFVFPWLKQKKTTRQRASTRDFFDHLKKENARRAFTLVTAHQPKAWLP